MKLFKVFAGILGFFGLIFLISLFFPHSYKIEKSTKINKPVSEVYAYMSTIENWKDWSPWNNQLDSTMKSFYSKIKSGAGATQYFSGDLVGVGRFKITECKPNEKVSYQLSINDGTMFSQAAFHFKDLKDQTEISWVDEGDVGYNPLFRFLLPNKIKSTEQAFEEGLVNIKKAAEAYSVQVKGN